MAGLQLSLACCNYDRTAALFDGRVTIEGCDVSLVPIEPEEAFHRAFKYNEFDVSEVSLSSSLVTISRHENHYVGIPAFVSRLFRHSSLYVRTDRGINEPKDLRGKTVGLPEYQLTANVWVRGILQDEYGVKPNEMVWRGGGLEDAGRGERAKLNLPSDIDFKPIPQDRTLSDMLEKGELDAVLSARAPSCFLRGAANVDRLFPNYPEVEGAYFQRTGIFPIMHMIGLRKSLAERHPWLAVSIYKAFIKAKELCMVEMGQIGHLAVSLPWGVAAYEQARRTMGADYWSYGIEPNRHVLDTLARYSFEQGLSARRVEVDEIFAPSVHELVKI